jgi:hypothetical protein
MSEEEEEEEEEEKEEEEGGSSSSSSSRSSSSSSCCFDHMFPFVTSKCQTGAVSFDRNSTFDRTLHALQL